MRADLTLTAVSVLLLTAVGGGAQESPAPDGVTEADKPYLLTYPNLEDTDGRVVLTNEHVVLQRLVVPAGKWEGIHSHPGNQIYVHIEGGEWSGRLGGESEYSGSISPDGGVGWMDPIPLSARHESGNTGDSDIDLIYVTRKDDAPITPEVEESPQEFPDIPMELVLENDLMIVQRAWLEPGQWTGVHGHPGNQVYIHIEDGTWSERRGGVRSDPETVEAGAVGWLDPIDPAEGHEVGNTGHTTLHLVLVTLK